MLTLRKFVSAIFTHPGAAGELVEAVSARLEIHGATRVDSTAALGTRAACRSNKILVAIRLGFKLGLHAGGVYPDRS